jgi:hypothetical protein
MCRGRFSQLSAYASRAVCRYGKSFDKRIPDFIQLSRLENISFGKNQRTHRWTGTFGCDCKHFPGLFSCLIGIRQADRFSMHVLKPHNELNSRPTNQNLSE